jgi:hypothetical protein
METEKLTIETIETIEMIEVTGENFIFQFPGLPVSQFHFHLHFFTFTFPACEPRADPDAGFKPSVSSARWAANRARLGGLGSKDARNIAAVAGVLRQAWPGGFSAPTAKQDPQPGRSVLRRLRRFP